MSQSVNMEFDFRLYQCVGGSSHLRRAKNWREYGRCVIGQAPLSPDVNYVPKKASRGDLLVVYKVNNQTYAAHLKKSQYHFTDSNPPAILQCEGNAAQEGKLTLKTTDALTEAGIDLFMNELEGEVTVLEQSKLEYQPGDLIIGVQRNGAYDWWIRKSNGLSEKLEREHMVAIGEDDSVALSSYLKSIENEELEEFQKDVRDSPESIALLRVLAKFHDEYGKQMITEEVAHALLEAIPNLAPGPVAGTTLPVDLATLFGGMAKINNSKSGNIFDNRLEIDLDDSASAGFGGVGAANAFLGAFGALWGFVLEAKQWQISHRALQGRQSGTGAVHHTGERATAAATATGEAVKVVKGLFEGITKCVDLAKSFSTTAAGAATAAGVGVSATSGALGIILGGLATTRAVRKAHRAQRRIRALKKLLAENDGANLRPDMKGCVRYALDKITARRNKQIFTSISAALGGVGGTVLMVTTIVGIANAWNPVGWAIIGTGALVGMFIGGYVLYRRYTRHRRQLARILEYGVGSSQDLSLKLVAIANDEEHSNANIARYVLSTIFGVEERDVEESRWMNERDKESFVKDVTALISRRFTK